MMNISLTNDDHCNVINKLRMKIQNEALNLNVIAAESTSFPLIEPLDYVYLFGGQVVEFVDLPSLTGSFEP